MNLSVIAEKFRAGRKYLTWRVVIVFLIGYLCLWLFAKLQRGIAGNYWIVQFDQSLADELHASATTTSTTIFLFISLLGNEVLWIVRIAVALYFLVKRQWSYAAVWLVGAIMGDVLNFAFKAYYARPRPVFENPLATAALASFPSGHAMQSIIGYGLLAYFLMVSMKNLRLRVIVLFVAVLLIALIGISRLYLGVHYFSDVLAGYAAGGIWLMTCIVAAEFVRQRKLSHST